MFRMHDLLLDHGGRSLDPKDLGLCRVAAKGELAGAVELDLVCLDSAALDHRQRLAAVPRVHQGHLPSLAPHHEIVFAARDPLQRCRPV